MGTNAVELLADSHVGLPVLVCGWYHLNLLTLRTREHIMDQAFTQNGGSVTGMAALRS